MAGRDLEPPRRSSRQSEAYEEQPRRKKSKKQPKNPFDKNSGLSFFVANGGFDLPFFAATLALVTIGLVMLFSATYPYALQNEGDSYFYFKRQLIFAVAGVIVMLLVSKLNYKFLKVIERPLFVISICLLILVLFYHVDVVRNGEEFKRWIPFGPITVQPSDIAKFALILALAAYISKNYRKMKNFKEGVIFPALLVGSCCVLIYLENHLSCTLLVFMIGLALMFCGGTRWEYYVAGLCFVAVVAIIVIKNPDVLPGYQGNRIRAWTDKAFEPRGLRWQTNNSLYAIGSGGFWGVGLGNSKQKYLYVSEPQNDFIFAVVCEELGFIGATLIIGLFGILFWRGVKIAQRCEDRFSSLVVIGIVAQVAIQTIFNILVVTDTIPNTGIALPFFSYGGTSLLMLCFEMGVVLSISRKVNTKNY